MAQRAARGRPASRRCASISAKPSRHGRTACSVTCTTSWPAMAMAPAENGSIPGRKRYCPAGFGIGVGVVMAAIIARPLGGRLPHTVERSPLPPAANAAQGGSDMLSREDNERITRVGRGTPMGNTMRRYWIPALLARELREPDGAPVRVRLLGEDLIAFR